MAAVTVSSKGQIAIPKRIRDQLQLKRGTVLQLQLRGRQIVLSLAADWRALRGAARGTDLLAALREERQAELEKDARR